MKKQTTYFATLANDFHNSTARVLVGLGNTELSASQIRRLRSKLCGIAGCACGGVLGQRGPQPLAIVEYAPGKVVVGLDQLI